MAKRNTTKPAADENELAGVEISEAAAASENATALENENAAVLENENTTALENENEEISFSDKALELKDNRIFIPGIGTVEKKNFTMEHYNYMVEEFGEAEALKYVK